MNQRASIFCDYFLRKAKIELALQLTEEVLNKKNVHEDHITIAKNLVYLTFIYLQGSLQTSGSRFATAALLSYAGLSEENAEWMGLIVGGVVSLAIDPSLFNFSLSTIGGYTGKLFARCGYEKVRDLISHISVGRTLFKLTNANSEL